MDDRSGFEARAVIAPRRGRRARAALLLPVVGLVAIVLVGVSGARHDKATAMVADATAVVHVPPMAHEAAFPAEVLGIYVQPLDAVNIQGLSLDSIVAVAGWYVPQLTANCRPWAALFIRGPFPNDPGYVDPYAFCSRSGVFYTSRPEPDAPVLIDSTEGVGSRSAGFGSISASIVESIAAPHELEAIGSAAQVVVLGRFVYAGNACGTAAACRQLLIDYVAWTPGA